MILGPIWRQQFGIPYVIDLQDPWLHYYYMQTGTPPPGGKTKHGLARRVAHLLEPRVMRHVSQVICVSPAYPDMLMREYPHLARDQFEVLPMGGAASDFETLASLPLQQTFFEKNDGNLHWVYVGAAGLMMRPALRLLFAALQRARQREPGEWKQLRVHFIGTSYAPAGRGIKTVEPLAAEFGLSDLIEEQTDRVGYFEALRTLTDGHAILVIGSDSPSYSPSKLYPYMLTGKPMLSIMHEESPAIPILRTCHAGLVVPFKPGPMNDQIIDELIRALELLRSQSLTKSAPEIDWQAFEPYTARVVTSRQCAVFDKASGVK